MTLEDARALVFHKRPGLCAFVERWGTRPCVDYYRDGVVSACAPTDLVRDVIVAEARDLLGEESARRVERSLVQTPWVSTADHHGVLNHPYFYTSALARTHHTLASADSATVVLAFGNISLSNDSFPRGLIYHDRTLTERRWLFKSLLERRMPVARVSPIARAHFARELERTLSLEREPRVRSALAEIGAAFLSHEAVWGQERYGAQLTLLNKVWWQTLFGDARGELVYLEIERIVEQALVSLHICSETPLYRALFDSVLREQYLALFADIQGAHARDGSWGTHFFWYVDRAHGTRRRLLVRGDVLATPEGDVTIPLAPEAIALRLSRGDLIPGTALSLIVVHAEGGLACAGGFSQIDYLARMNDSWAKFLALCGAEHALPHPSVFAGEYALFGVRDAAGRVLPATLLDLALYSDTRSSHIDDALSQVSFQEALDTMMPTLYWLLTREHPLCDNTAAPIVFPVHV